MNYKVHFKDDSSSLTHWGIKGQRWGVRRYQNEDGTLTPEGKKRYDKIENIKSGAKYGAAALIGVGGNATSATLQGLSTKVDMNAKSPGKAPNKDDYSDKDAYRDAKDEWDNKKARYDEKIKVSKELGEVSRSAKRDTTDIANKLISDTQKKDIERLRNSVDLSSMSDDELRRKINRISMEKQYKSLTTPETTSGAEIASTIIGLTGGVTSIALDGLSIAKAIKDLSS